MRARSLTPCEVLLAGLVLRTRSKPAAVGSPSKKDDKSTANGDDAEKTKASDEVLLSCPPVSFALAFLVGRVFEVFRPPIIGGRVGASTNRGWVRWCVDQLLVGGTLYSRALEAWHERQEWWWRVRVRVRNRSTERS